MSILLKNVIFNNKETDLLVEGNLIKKISKGINTKADDKIDCKGSKAIIPGLYNMHTHAAMSLLRGFADDMPLMDWLQNKIWPLEEKLSEDDVYWGSKLAFLEMVRTGTIFFNDMYFFPEASVRAAEEMGLRALIGLVVFGGSKMSNPKTAQANLAKFRKMGLKTTQFAIAPHAIYTVGAEELKWCAQFEKNEKILLHTHLSETNTEVEDCLRQNKKRPVQYLDSLGLLGGQSILAHGVYLDKKEEGVNITIGTDGAASNNNLDLMQEMKISALAQKHKQKDACQYPAKEVLQSATKNGAKAAGLNGGEIKEGKLADFVLLDLNKIPLVPGFNIESDIVYASAGDTVSDVIINGQEILRDGFFVSENENLIKKKAKAVAHNLVSKK